MYHHYWIADLPARRFDIYADPSGAADQPEYRHHQDYGPSDALPVVIDGVEVGRMGVQELLP